MPQVWRKSRSQLGNRSATDHRVANRRVPIDEAQWVIGWGSIKPSAPPIRVSDCRSGRINQNYIAVSEQTVITQAFKGPRQLVGIPNVILIRKSKKAPERAQAGPRLPRCGRRCLRKALHRFGYRSQIAVQSQNLSHPSNHRQGSIAGLPPQFGPRSSRPEARGTPLH